MDWNQIEGDWQRLKGHVKEKWGQLTDDEIDKINGHREQLEGKIQERYGIARDKAKKEVDFWFESNKVVSWPREKGSYMRPIRSACFGFALAVSALTLASTSSSAVETSALPPAVSSNVTKADWSGHCDRWRVRCHALYPAGDWRFRRCLTIHACHR